MIPLTRLIIYGLILLVFSERLVLANPDAQQTKCNPINHVYGYNEPIDQVLLCAMSKTSDLDLIPKGEIIKSTSKTLVEQGFSNKTVILYAKLTGLWTARRARLVETGWKCEQNETTSTSLLESNGISLNVIEKVDIPLNHKSNLKHIQHKPCKSLDLPIWMCRQVRPLYRTTRTWSNRVYLNLTLSQQTTDTRPKIKSLNIINDCRETFKQKITYSPSAMHIIGKFLGNQPVRSVDYVSDLKKRETGSEEHSNIVTHPVSYASIQSGKDVMYPSTVSLMLNHATDILQSTINECIDRLDLELPILAQQSSFTDRKFSTITSEIDNKVLDNISTSGSSKCSGEKWLVNELETSLKADSDREKPKSSSTEAHDKRSQQLLNYPTDPDRLLNPYGYYYENAGLLDDIAEE